MRFDMWYFYDYLHRLTHKSIVDETNISFNSKTTEERLNIKFKE